MKHIIRFSDEDIRNILKRQAYDIARVEDDGETIVRIGVDDGSRQPLHIEDAGGEVPRYQAEIEFVKPMIKQ